MGLPASFSNNTSPTGVQLDQNFAVLGTMGTTFCTTTGTNTITITPVANQPTVAAYTNQQLFGFTAANSSSGSVSLQVAALASLPLYLIGGAQAGSGDITNGTPYIIEYLSALNSGGGGFQIVSAVPSSAAVAQAPGSVRGLSIANNSGTPNTKIDISGGYSVLTTTGGTPKFLASFSATLDLTTTGANGMDTGARPTSGWVYCYVINNGSVTATLGTATAPSAGLPSPFPGGYVNFTYAGAMFLDGSQNLLRTKQKGRRAQYTLVAATNTAAYPTIASGSNSSTMGPFSVTALVPLTANEIFAIVFGGTSSAVGLAPNATNTIGTTATSFSAINNSSGNALGMPISILLESTNVYYGGSNAASAAYATGWNDYFSAG